MKHWQFVLATSLGCVCCAQNAEAANYYKSTLPQKNIYYPKSSVVVRYYDGGPNSRSGNANGGNQRQGSDSRQRVIHSNQPIIITNQNVIVTNQPVTITTQPVVVTNQTPDITDKPVIVTPMQSDNDNNAPVEVSPKQPLVVTPNEVFNQQPAGPSNKQLEREIRNYPLDVTPNHPSVLPPSKTVDQGARPTGTSSKQTESNQPFKSSEPVSFPVKNTTSKLQNDTDSIEVKSDQPIAMIDNQSMPLTRNQLTNQSQGNMSVLVVTPEELTDMIDQGQDVFDQPIVVVSQNNELPYQSGQGTQEEVQTYHNEGVRDQPVFSPNRYANDSYSPYAPEVIRETPPYVGSSSHPSTYSIPCPSTCPPEWISCPPVPCETYDEPPFYVNNDYNCPEPCPVANGVAYDRQHREMLRLQAEFDAPYTTAPTNAELFIPMATTSWIGFAGTYGNGLGGDPGHATAEIFLSKAKGDYRGTWLPFLDVRAHWLRNNRWAGNAGTGIRWLNPRQTRIWGANVFYDYRHAGHGEFNQVGVGFETLGKCWDIRVNGYLPVGKTKVLQHSHKFNFSLGRYMIRQVFDFAMLGFDSELGLHLLRCGNFTLYAAAGPYYYYHGDIEGKGTWGGQARLAIEYNRYVCMEGRVTHDHLFHTRVQGVLKVIIPFDLLSCLCGSSPYSCWDMLSQPIERNDLIINKKGCCWKQNFRNPSH